MTRRLSVFFSVLLLACTTLARPSYARSTPQPVPDLGLAAALSMMPDTPTTRAAGVWYADYARAERLYGASTVRGVADPHIADYFTAIRPLRMGDETGVADLADGSWRRRYGYDLFDIASDIFTDGVSHTPVAIATGLLDTGAIGRKLTAEGYVPTSLNDERFFVRKPLQPLWIRSAPMNAVVLGPNTLIAGSRPADVATASQRSQAGMGTLGLDPAYVALADALGPVTGAYLAANVPLPVSNAARFNEPSGGHAGAPLHPFSLYAVAYREPTPGTRILKIALYYPQYADALADVPTLTARFQTEDLPVYGGTWTSVANRIQVGAYGSGNIVLIFVYMKPDVPLTFWQNAATDGDLSILSP